MRKILLGIKKALFSSDLQKEKQIIEDVEIAYENDEGEENEKEMEHGYDEVYLARQSNDLEKMLKATELETTLSNRHFLLQAIVSETYRLRKEEEYKNLCLKFSEKHLEEFDEITKSLKEEFEGFTPIVTTFQYYSTLLTELEEYEKAIKVCEIAISYRLEDGTKGCYQGRIDRIKKKMSVDKLKAYNIQNITSFSDTNLTKDENKLTEEKFNKKYSEGEIKTFIRDVVREAQDTVKVETGFLKRSIRGALIGNDCFVEFRQVYYGAKNGNSRLLEIAINKMPKDLKWSVILLDDDGREIFRKA
jgi:hypothetical protein